MSKNTLINKLFTNMSRSLLHLARVIKASCRPVRMISVDTTDNKDYWMKIVKKELSEDEKKMESEWKKDILYVERKPKKIDIDTCPDDSDSDDVYAYKMKRKNCDINACKCGI